jgi:6-phosphogluconolactonase (cycloisomerase 2 family)
VDLDLGEMQELQAAGERDVRPIADRAAEVEAHSGEVRPGKIGDEGLVFEVGERRTAAQQLEPERVDAIRRGRRRVRSIEHDDLADRLAAAQQVRGACTETRTMALADDGESLYVVNYQDGTVSKVRTSDMEIIQTVYSGVHPVGIT